MFAQSIKLVAMPNNFGMLDNIVQLEWHAGELDKLCLLCFLKRGFHLKVSRHRLHVFLGRGRQFVVQTVTFDRCWPRAGRVLSLTRETPLFD